VVYRAVAGVCVWKRVVIAWFFMVNLWWIDGGNVVAEKYF
jgi:hypothetical protein